jgi:hypothetical protein
MSGGEGTKEKLLAHIGHPIVIATYGDGWDVTVECEKCNEVLVSSEDFEEETE